jgi:hypothetical protein
MNVSKISRENSPLTSSGGALTPNNNFNNNNNRKTAAPQKNANKQINGRASVSPVTVSPTAVKQRQEREGIASTRNVLVEVRSCKQHQYASPFVVFV